MKLLNFTIIKLTACLILGILIQYYLNFSFYSISIVLINVCFILISSYIYSNYTYKSSSVFGVFALIAFIILGAFTYAISNDTLNKYHYSHLNLNEDEPQNIHFSVNKRLKSDLYNDKYFIDIISINAEKVEGKLLLNIPKDSLQQHLDVGSVYGISSKLENIQTPLNPFQFNYNKYLKDRQVYYQIYKRASPLLKIEGKEVSLSTYADAFRKTINSKLIYYGFKGDTLSIINALLLGQRQDIDPDLYTNYVNAGTIHILAVSGLHVGIILLILNFLLKPLHRTRYGRHYIKPIVIVIALWAFAIIAGLSPSVTRAVTMFSVIAIAMHLKRQTSIYNTIAISAFFILLFKPVYVFDVGFQMSYLAVISIVSIQPLLYKLWSPRFYVTDKFWQIFTVTIAAQCGVAPISLYYFHQFPGLFFISNLVIIPFLGLILGLGLFIIGLALINKLPEFLVDFYTFIIDTLNGFIAWIAQFENFLFRDISFNYLQVISAYFFICSGFYLWKNKNTKTLYLPLLSLALYSGVLLYSKYRTTTHEFIIFNKSRYSILAEKKNNSLSVYHNLDTLLFKQDKTLQNYKIGNSIDFIKEDSISSVFRFKNKIVFVIDSLSAYNIKSFKPDYILLRNSPQLNLKRVIDTLKPKVIIADASNYKSYVERWKLTCEAKKIPFHSTYEKGAYIIK
ncbi:ComEC/Rec2 family competence protein [Winogradskyella immobilis]|uniref:ComEC/Rec2 family competence protein n=1 Tax=Winogradskyella immobilis TaxID=2816852 RepID=A0ABS8EJH8_9FLAO|nr:ComEC/Rec2 family competence protein [Winogradskyella immobilis]MCC1483186.1 ComEC/Rec2 family competence protein [Winogradskyella immobilis]MCG0015281.1 competence protein ComEC family protein [Winogradskyella immobilis]